MNVTLGDAAPPNITLLPPVNPVPLSVTVMPPPVVPVEGVTDVIVGPPCVLPDENAFANVWLVPLGFVTVTATVPGAAGGVVTRSCEELTYVTLGASAS